MIFTTKIDFKEIGEFILKKKLDVFAMPYLDYFVRSYKNIRT